METRERRVYRVRRDSEDLLERRDGTANLATPDHQDPQVPRENHSDTMQRPWRPFWVRDRQRVRIR